LIKIYDKNSKIYAVYVGELKVKGGGNCILKYDSSNASTDD
jgi:hypothetical protein